MSLSPARALLAGPPRAGTLASEGCTGARYTIASDLPADSRETDEHEGARRLRELRGRVKAARAVVATTPGLAETLARDWQKVARFYERFGITESQLWYGVPGPASKGEFIPSDAVTRLDTP